MLRVTPVWLMNLRPYSPTWKAVTDCKSSEDILSAEMSFCSRSSSIADLASCEMLRNILRVRVAHGHALGGVVHFKDPCRYAFVY